MKSMTNEQWQTYEHLIKTILLGLGILLFINTYSKLKLPTMLIVVEVFFIGLMIDQINKYKKYGAPMTAATIPIEISFGDSSVREIISETVIKSAPVRTVVPINILKLGPTRRRAR